MSLASVLNTTASALGLAPSSFGPAVWPVFSAVLGLVAGAVANSLIDRLPLESPFERPLLTCDNCRRRGWPFDAVPILGWLLRNGRCRYCRLQISVQKPVVEAVMGVLWLLIAGAMPPSLRAVILMLFVATLLTLALIDLEVQILPDVLTLPGIVLGVACTKIPGWPVSFLDSALSAGVGYFAMMALAKAAEMYYGEEALGQGDWKMVAMIGAFLGSSKLGAVVIAANLSGALVGLLLVALMGSEGRQRLPLGTFLGAAGIVMVFV